MYNRFAILFNLKSELEIDYLLTLNNLQENICRKMTLRSDKGYSCRFLTLLSMSIACEWVYDDFANFLNSVFGGAVGKPNLCWTS